MDNDIFITFLIDCSGSMGYSTDEINTALAVMKARMMGDRLHKYHLKFSRIGLDDEGIFGDEAVAHTIGDAFMTFPHMDSPGSTPLYKAIIESLDTVNDPAANGHKSICIIMTDGGDSYTWGNPTHGYTFNRVKDLIVDKVDMGWHFAMLAFGEGGQRQNSQIAKLIKAKDRLLVTNSEDHFIPAADIDTFLKNVEDRFVKG